MELPRRILRPFVGARIIKTGLAVFAAVITLHWFGSEYATFAAVAAVLAVQPSVNLAREAFGQQMLGNLVGGVVAAAVGMLGSNPLSNALGVVIVLGLLTRFRLNETANLAVVVFLFVMDRPHHDFLLYTAARVATVAVGMLIGFLVNRFIHPPDFSNRLRGELDAVGSDVDAFVLHLIDSLAIPEDYAKTQIKSEAASILRRLDTVRHFLNLSAEWNAGSSLRLSLEKATASMFVFVERIMDIHKLVLQAGGLGHSPQRGAVAQALENVIRYRQDVMGAALAQRSPSPEWANDFAGGLIELEDLIDRQVDNQETRPLGMALYAVLTNIRHMGWRMASLARLLPGSEES